MRQEHAFARLLSFLQQLEAAKIHYSLSHSRDDAIMAEIVVPGERWEVEFVSYGAEVHVEIERFRNDGAIADERMLEDLFSKYAD